MVRNDLPVNNLKEFAAYLKANQTKMRFGSAGIGAAPYLACAMMTAAIGATATHVPYRSAAPALEDMVRGDIDYYCPLAISVNGMLASNSVKALAILTRERSPLFPDLPTAREQGFDVVDGYYWMGVFAPAETPAPVVETLNTALGSALDDPRSSRGYATRRRPSSRRTGGRAAYLKDFLASEITKWAAIMKESDVPQQ